MQNWVFDSNETSRYIAAGGYNRKPQGRVRTVASSTYIGDADYYCDGTADEVEINNAINVLQVLGGGTVQLTEGTFNLAAKISGYSNIAICGFGPATIISGSSANYVSFDGTVGTPFSNCRMYNFQTLGTWLNLTYVNNSSVDSIWVTNPSCDSTKAAINVETSNSTSVILCMVNGNSIGEIKRGIRVTGTNNIVHANTVQSLRSSTGTLVGIVCFGGRGTVVNNVIYDLLGSINDTNGIYIMSDQNVISSNRIEQTKTTAGGATTHGIFIVSGIGNLVSHNYCYNNGLDTGIANTNGCNFSDVGTDTQYSG
jgi:hypothetical protein